MTKDLDLSIREIDDLLQHLYLKLRGKKEGLSLAEPASILLSQLKTANPSFYAPQLARFTPIIMDTLISGAYISFGFEGLQRLNDVAGDIAIATGDYIPAGVEEGLSKIRNEIEAISAILKGDSPGTGPMADITGKSETGTGGFFRESAWGTVGLPLVSIYNTGKTPFSTGRVVKARVEIRITGEWSIRKKHDPVVTFDHISAEPNSTFETQIRTAIAVAEKYVAAVMEMKGIVRVPREYRISLPEIASFPTSAIQRLSGGSAGLAIAALLISVLSSLDLYRQRSKFNTGTSFTGKVDENGKVLAVEDSHIADKVRAVFFSRFSRLVLPAGNYETAEKELAILSGEYPSRKLDFVAAPDVAGIFRDSGVTATSRTPTGKPLLQRLFMWRKHLAASFILPLLALLTLFILPPYLDRKVDSVEMLGGKALMKNRYGRLLMEYDAGFRMGFSNQHSRTYFHDLSDHPGKEILIIASESRQERLIKTKFERLHFLVFTDKGRLLHDHTYNQEEVMGGEMDAWAYEKVMTMLPSNAVFLDELGKGIVAVCTNYSTYTPTSVIKADVNTGEFEVFFHYGYLTEMVAGDFDGDGKREILLGGFNLSLDASVIAVLDPAHMEGSSPSGHGYNVYGMNADIAKFYIKFPEFRRAKRYPGPMYVLGVSILNTADNLTLSVKSRAEDVEYTFTEGMRLSNVKVCMSHSRANNRPDSISTISYKGKTKDEIKLKRGVRYWTGKDWVSEPTMNRSYLQHSGQKVDSTITRITHEETTLRMRNALGIVIARYDIGFDISDSSVYLQFFFGDYLDDAGDEILVAAYNSWITATGDPDRNKLFVLLFDKKGHLMRRHVYDEEAILGSELDRFAHNVNLQMIKTSSPFSEETGPGQFFICTHHKTEPPASLIRLSLDNGSYETFFHKGFLEEMATRDIDGDGKSELILTGYNVALESPVIVVLDPDHIDGSSPEGACYGINGRGQDIAKYYVRLPSYHRFVKYISRVWSLHAKIFENDEKLRIKVKSRAEEAIFTIEEGMIVSNVKIFNKIRNSNGYLDSLVVMDSAETEKAELLNGVRYWNGTSWVSEPTVNKSYLKHVAGDDR